MTPAIEVEELTVSFPGKKKITAVRDLSFSVSQREFVCLLGTTGCGKSTILNVLGGFIEPTSGRAYFDGDLIRKPGTERGMVFQQHALFPWQTVRGNIEFGLKLKGVDGKQRRRQIDTYMKMVGLEEFEDSYPDELSGGMRQRVGIARALVNEPQVLLMDEPFGSLDAQTRMLMQEMLTEIWENHHRTVVFVTHDVDEAIFLGDRLCILTAGPARLKEIINVPLPRPRTYDMMVSRLFTETKENAMTLIREETLKSMSKLQD